MSAAVPLSPGAGAALSTTLTQALAPPGGALAPLVQDNALPAVLSAVNGIHTDMTNLRNEVATFRNGLANDFMPRRESESLFHQMQTAMGEFNARLVSQEEWRLSETKRAGDAQMAVQAQIQAAVVQAMRDNTSARISAQADASGAQQAGLSRMNAVLLSIVMVLLGGASSLVVSLIAGIVLFAVTHGFH